jgi:flagellar protein FliO/FliZ
LDSANELIAALPSDPGVAGDPEFWGTMLKSFGMLLIVLGVLIAVLWLIKRYFAQQGSMGQPGVIRLLSSMYVAPKERIALIDVLGEKILIGITSQQISFLARIQDEKNVCPTEPPASNGFFRSLLKKKINGASIHSKKKETHHRTD